MGEKILYRGVRWLWSLRTRENVIWLVAALMLMAGMLIGWATIFFGYSCATL